MMSTVWKNTNDTKVWKRCTRYEKDAQGMKKIPKVWKMCPRYERDPQSYKMRFQVWKRSFLEKQWFFIPLWVYFIPFWVWKKLLFFPEVGRSAHNFLPWSAARRSAANRERETKKPLPPCTGTGHRLSNVTNVARVPLLRGTETHGAPGNANHRGTEACRAPQWPETRVDLLQQVVDLVVCRSQLKWASINCCCCRRRHTIWEEEEMMMSFICSWRNKK